MDVNLVKAGLTDIPEITRLAGIIWEKHYVPIIGREQVDYMLKMMYSSESLTEQMIQKKHNFYLIYYNNEIAGFASISSPDGKNYMLHKFYVLQLEQNKGLGSAVFALLQKEMRSLETIRLTVNRQNYRSINFYFKNGFKIEKVEDFDIGNGYKMNDFVMLWSK